jgi:uncharacterized membrane-anchored protein
VAGPLSARLSGEDYRMAVQPVDPIDPFRGAYVALGYPGLNVWVDGRPVEGEPPSGTVYVRLVPDGALHRAGAVTTTRPSTGPYLRCSYRGGQPHCGIESYFLPQGAAGALGQALARGGAVARIKVDGRGNAALIGVEVSG